METPTFETCSENVKPKPESPSTLHPKTPELGDEDMQELIRMRGGFCRG